MRPCFEATFGALVTHAVSRDPAVRPPNIAQEGPMSCAHCQQPTSATNLYALTVKVYCGARLIGRVEVFGLHEACAPEHSEVVVSNVRRKFSDRADIDVKSSVDLNAFL
jgi:hypothetical protein